MTKKLSQKKIVELLKVVERLNLEELVLKDYDELFILDVLSDCKVATLLNSNGHCNDTVCPICRVDDFTHIEGCPKNELLNSI